MRLKIPPVLQTLIFGLSIWITDKYLTIDKFSFSGQKILALSIFLIGATVGLVSVWQFYKKKTSVDPRDPSKASKLVTHGLYNLSRNPMYLGLAIILFSFVLWLGNIFTLIPLLLFIWFNTTYQIKPEEEVLENLFGEDFSIYCKKVRRWI